MTGKPFTTETAKSNHKRWWKIELWIKQLSKAYLNLCEAMTWKKRSTIVVEFSRNKLDPSNAEDVEIYLRGRIEWLIEKKIETIKPVITKPKITMDEIMSSIANKPTPTIQWPQVYIPKTDKDGFYDD